MPDSELSQPEADQIGGDGSALRCPKCHGSTRVGDSRPKFDSSTIKRRRYCKGAGCGFRFTTYEIVAEEGFTPAGLGNLLRETLQILGDVQNRIVTARMQLERIDMARTTVQGRK